VNAAINPNVQPDAPRENGDVPARKVPELARTPDAKYSMMYLADPKIRSAYERRIKDHDRVKHMSELDVKQVAAALSYSAMFIHFI
jgi:hypothetical protein